MAVIINELEVVLEAPEPAKEPKPQTPAPQEAGQSIRPLDIEDILSRDARAQYRLLAH
jgi:hypothetical protein